MIKEIAKTIYISTRSCILPFLKYWNTKALIHKYDKVYGKGQYLIINPPQGLGDILACCCGIEYLNTGDRKVFIIVSKKYFFDIRDFFPEGYVNLVFINKWLSDKSYPDYMSLNRKVYYPEKPYISMKYNICLAMGIPTNVVFRNQYRKKNSLNGLTLQKEQKTVLISPFATSCQGELNYEFWDSLSNTLKEKGYDVIYNAPSNSYFGKKNKTCMLKLDETVELVTKCGYFIGWRSGLCDIIGMFSDAKVIVIYPSNPNRSPYMHIPSGLSYAEAYMNSCSLKSLWGTEAIEIINNNNLFDQIISEFENVE